MIYCFDLDGTLCTNTNGYYADAKPIPERIKIVNDLFDSGNYIIVDTARGKKTGIDWTELTKQQLDFWGIKYNELIVGKKTHYDILVDDKCINDILFFEKKT